MTDRDRVLAAYRTHVNSGLARLAELTGSPITVRGDGDFVVDERGRRLLNCGGFSVFLFGHGHPPVVEAVTGQLAELALTGPMTYHEQLALAAEELAGICPGGLDYVLLTNSGAEACEAALKLARLNGKRHLVAMAGGFHGKTAGALSVTGRTAFRAPFAPLLPDVEFAEFGDLDSAAELITPGSCVLVEPVQGEGGVQIPPPGYLRGLARLCADTGALLVADEVQTGLGRTGWRWAVDSEDVVPDVLLSGKALGGGVLPVGAVVATPAVFAPLNRDPVLHTSTFGGNPLAAAAVRATVRSVLDLDAPGRARALQERLRAVLTTATAACAHLITGIRGRGALFGIEFASPADAGRFVLELLDRDVVVCPAGNSLRTVRFTPSVLFGQSELDVLDTAVRGAAAELARENGSASTLEDPCAK